MIETPLLWLQIDDDALTLKDNTTCNSIWNAQDCLFGFIFMIAFSGTLTLRSQRAIENLGYKYNRLEVPNLSDSGLEN